MNNVCAVAVCGIFLTLALWHVFHALVPSSGAGESTAVPTVGGRPVFSPSRTATLVVATALFAFAGLVAATAGIVSLPVSPVLLHWLSYALAAGLLARAVGEFKYVGFFKRVRGTRFATLDTFVYSPLCLLLAAGVVASASRRTA